MKKIMILLVFVLNFGYLYSLPGYNVFARTWELKYNDTIADVIFYDDGTVMDSNGEILKYDWDYTYLYIYTEDGENFKFKITFSDYDTKFVGTEINFNFTITGRTVN